MMPFNQHFIYFLYERRTRKSKVHEKLAPITARFYLVPGMDQNFAVMKFSLGEGLLRTPKASLPCSEVILNVGRKQRVRKMERRQIGLFVMGGVG